jgi:hypothetical protein
VIAVDVPVVTFTVASGTATPILGGLAPNVVITNGTAVSTNVPSGRTRADG